MNNNSEISTVDMQKKKPQEVWDLVMEDKLKWLKKFYQKSKPEQSQKAMASYKRVEELIGGLKNKIKESKYNENDKYFQKFRQNQVEKFIPKSATFNSKLEMEKYYQGFTIYNYIQQKQDTLPILDNNQYSKKYRDLLLRNHKQIISYLTYERYSFQNIAYHIHQQKKDQINRFFFYEQQGLSIKSIQLVSIGLMFVFVRDLTKAIRQLKKYNILHFDLNLKNILLYYSDNPQGIKQLRQLLLDKSKDIAKEIDKVIDKLKFKVVGFDCALIVNKELKENNYNMIKCRFDINKSKKCYIKNDIFSSHFKDQNDHKILAHLAKKQITKESQKKIKEIYLNSFSKCIKEMSGKLKVKVFEIQQYLDLLGDGQEQKIIRQMQIMIAQFKENPQKLLQDLKDKIEKSKNFIERKAPLQKIKIDLEKYYKGFTIFNYNENQVQDYSSAFNTIFQNYRIFLQNNHNQIIKYLINERYSFQTIAYHIYQQKYNKNNEFFFKVQQGLPIQSISQLSVGIMFVFVRDLVKAIKQLKKYDILHLDLFLRNILIYFYATQGTDQLKRLKFNDPKTVALIIDKLKFKVIDFGDALILNEKFKENNQKLIKCRFDINRSTILYVKYDIFSSNFKDQKDHQILADIAKEGTTVTAKGKIKQIYLNSFSNSIKEVGDKVKDQVFNHQYYLNLLKEDKEQKIISQMQEKIAQFKKKHQ